MSMTNPTKAKLTEDALQVARIHASQALADSVYYEEHFRVKDGRFIEVSSNLDDAGRPDGTFSWHYVMVQDCMAPRNPLSV